MKLGAKLSWVFPGAGHYIMGNKGKGLFFTSLELAALAGVAAFGGNYSTQSDLYNSELSGYGFLTIPSKPAGAQIKIDDQIINKQTPLIDEKLSVGYHTITIFKKGYKEFFERIFITPNETIILNPILKMVKGLISFDGLPENSKIFMDDQYLGKSPIESFSLNQGKHKVKMEISGFELIPEYEILIDSSKLYSLSLPKLVPKTKIKAALRSIILPGWGQYYYEKPKTGLGIGLTSVIVGTYSLFQKVG